jgi:hypothetical protein
MLTGMLVTAGFLYLLHQIQDSRWETAVKSCQINRAATHDSLEGLMVSLGKTDGQKAKATALADTYFPSDRAACERYAHQLGLEQ